MKSPVRQWMAALVGLALAAGGNAAAQVPHVPQAPASEPSAPEKETPPAPGKVEVAPAARDEQIRHRLRSILHATGWFDDAEVEVENGVVFLHGRTQTEAYKKWAGHLAQNTQDVAAVVNQIEVTRPSPWDFGPALSGLRDLQRQLIAGLPLFAFGIVILVAATALAFGCARALRAVLTPRVSVGLLREVFARTGGFLVFLLGLYIVLKIAGLTRLAVTVLGGTGLIGLVIGIAFRDITENFLASLLLSVQQPFRRGDLVELAGVLGYIQQLNVRTTILMTLSGNQVQVPNATVYKSTIRNYTSNPNRREDFQVGIGYDVDVPRAQEIALQILVEHPAVLNDPEPWVLVDGLGAASVNLRVYFWLDGRQHSWLKVRSSVIRLVKRAFQENGISMPDESREIIFPRGVPVQLTQGAAVPEAPAAAPPADGDAPATAAEGGLHSDAEDIEEQARQSRCPRVGGNLLNAHDTTGAPPPA